MSSCALYPSHLKAKVLLTAPIILVQKKHIPRIWYDYSINIYSHINSRGTNSLRLLIQNKLRQLISPAKGNHTHKFCPVNEKP